MFSPSSLAVCWEHVSATAQCLKVTALVAVAVIPAVPVAVAILVLVRGLRNLPVPSLRGLRNLRGPNPRVRSLRVRNLRVPSLRVPSLRVPNLLVRIRQDIVRARFMVNLVTVPGVVRGAGVAGGQCL
jgi:hypothetical protein